MKRRMMIVGAVTSAVMMIPSAAFAHACFNASRPAPQDAGSGPIVKGNWVWLPSIGVSFPAWGFDQPENFQNGKAHALLENSAACGNENRTTEQGVQNSDC